MRALLFVVALISTSCIHDNLLVCDDGTACPSGSVCLAGGGCGAIEDVNACSGVADGEPCTSAFGQGRCRGGACRATRCGDGTLDADEVCDDGNTENGDGCSGSCRSDETCGNGISELNEACDCGDAANPGNAFCAGTYNGGDICRADCTLVRCGNGHLDPMEVCDDGNVVSGDGCSGTCRSDETCGNGIVDVDEQCDDGNQISGDMCQPITCTKPRCGDHVLDPGEICDDGNNTPNDGCSYDCLSTEVCGNHIVDFFSGEQCDDGKNGLLHDGCTDTCRGEQTVWERTAAPAPPSGRHAHAVVYDSTRKTLIMFGGTTGALFETSSGVMHPIGDTWEWDPVAAHWTDRTSSGPSPRFAHAMAYDSTRHRIVLFGGFSGSTDSDLTSLGDTWEWDSYAGTWTQRTPAMSPPARGLHSMAFDPVSGHVMLFGGGVASTIGTGACAHLPSANLTDTWEWDGTTWTQRLPATVPPARIAGAMTYDSSRGRIVLTPGLPQNYTDTGTWEWNRASGDWIAAASSYSPSAFGYGLGYDAVHDKLALFGGENWNTSGCGTDTAQSWTILNDRATDEWADANLATSPSQRSFTAAAFAAVSGQTVVIGGQYLQNYTGQGQNEYSDVWNWDGTTWTQAQPAMPPALIYASMAYDSARQQIVLYGGSVIDGNEYGHTETWTWDGFTWTQRHPATSPGLHTAGAMAYDPLRDRVVLFGGGYDSDGYIEGTPETWEWDGNDWTKRLNSSPPSSRAGHSMAYDAARGVIVLFGGSTTVPSRGDAAPLGDTWTYNGSWSQVATTGPSPRFQASMAYDAVRQRVVLFGGTTAQDYNNGRTDINDTWEWNGTAWSLRATTGPAARDRHVLVDDPLALGVVMFGGEASVGQGGSLPLGVWRWDGANATWVAIPSPNLPAARYGHVGAYDGARHRIVLALGGDGSTTYNDTWTLQTALLGAFAPRDDDCSGGTDLDSDGLLGCADPDCWSWCNPACPPGTSCPIAARCGDHICTAPRENPVRCPGDCP